MKYRKSLLFSLLTITLWLCFLSGSIQAGNRDDLYEAGNDAYESKDYVMALKNLYAFYVLNESDIDANPDFKKKLVDRIANAEAILKLSYSSNPSIQEHNGRIRIITRQGGGSFTGTGREIDNLINNNAIDLESIQELNHKFPAMPSSGR